MNVEEHFPKFTTYQCDPLSYYLPVAELLISRLMKLEYGPHPNFLRPDNYSSAATSLGEEHQRRWFLKS